MSRLWLPSGEPSDGAQLREFVLGSLADGHDWSLEQLKQHACGLGLATTGASGRVLNIALVNLLRRGLVVRLPNGRWRLKDQSTQLLWTWLLSPPIRVGIAVNPEPDWRHRRMKFRNFIRILVQHGFELDRPPRGSHRIYKGLVGGSTRLVVVACHSENDDINPGTLASMIRQSGLPKHAFRG